MPEPLFENDQQREEIVHSLEEENRQASKP